MDLGALILLLLGLSFPQDLPFLFPRPPRLGLSHLSFSVLFLCVRRRQLSYQPQSAESNGNFMVRLSVITRKTVPFASSPFPVVPMFRNQFLGEPGACPHQTVGSCKLFSLSSCQKAFSLFLFLPDYIVVGAFSAGCVSCWSSRSKNRVLLSFPFSEWIGFQSLSVLPPAANGCSKRFCDMSHGSNSTIHLFGSSSIKAMFSFCLHGGNWADRLGLWKIF